MIKITVQVLPIVLEMVRKGNFHVEIVSADTNIQFKEHKHPNGDVHVEVEPNTEYFIRIKSDDKGLVVCKCFIDGVSLGYHVSFDNDSRRGVWRNIGLWNRLTSSESMQTLQVKSLCPKKAKSEQSFENSNETFWNGCVEVEFYDKIVLNGYKEQGDCISGWKPRTVKSIKESCGFVHNKTISTAIGKRRTKSKTVNGKRRRSRLGLKLATISIQYLYR